MLTLRLKVLSASLRMLLDAKNSENSDGIKKKSIDWNLLVAWTLDSEQILMRLLYEVDFLSMPKRLAVSTIFPRELEQFHHDFASNVAVFFNCIVQIACLTITVFQFLCN